MRPATETCRRTPAPLRFYLTGYDLADIDQKQVEAAFPQALRSGELQRHDFWPVDGSPYEIFRARGNNINHIALNGADSRSRSDAEVEGAAAALAQEKPLRSIDPERLRACLEEAHAIVPR